MLYSSNHNFLKNISLLFVLLFSAIFQKLYSQEPQIKNPKIIYVEKVSEQSGMRIRYNKSTDTFHLVNVREHRVDVLNSNFKTIKKIGLLGQGKGEFYCPMDLNYDCKNRIWVIDHFNARIQIFNNEGEYLTDFPKQNYVWSLGYLESQKMMVVNHLSADSFFALLNDDGSLKYISHPAIQNDWLLNSLTRKDTSLNTTSDIFKKRNRAFMTSGYVRADHADNLFFLSMFAPTLIHLNIHGEIFYQKTIGLDVFGNHSKKIISQNIQKIINNSSEALEILFQDFFVDYSNQYIYILPTFANLMLFNLDGEFIREYVFIDSKEEQQVWPISFFKYDKNKAVIIANMGIYKISFNDNSL